MALLLACCVSIFAACDNRDYDHTITFYSSQNDDLQGKTKAAIDAFEAKYPGWHVDHQSVGGYDDVRNKTIAALSAKKQPDIAYCYPDHVSLYMQTGKVVDMKQYIDNTAGTVSGIDSLTNESADFAIGYTQAEIDNFIEVYYNEGRAENFSDFVDYGFTKDSMLMMPFMKSTELLFYNATALKALGKPVPTTWDELWSYEEDFKKMYPKGTLLGYDSDANWFITESQRQGWGYTSTDPNNHYLFNNDRAAAWLDTLGGHRTQIQTQGKYETYTSNLFKLGLADNAGGLLFCVGSSGGAKNQMPSGNKFEVGIARVPGSKVFDAQGKPVIDETTGEQKIDYQCISQGPSLCMLKSDKAKDPDQKALMTWMFIKELYDPTIQASVSMLQGYCTPLKNTAEVVADYANFLDDAFADEAHTKVNNITAAANLLANELSEEGLLFTSPAFVGSSEARTQVGNALQYVVEGTTKGKGALEEAYNNCL